MISQCWPRFLRIHALKSKRSIGGSRQHQLLFAESLHLHPGLLPGGRPTYDPGWMCYQCYQNQIALKKRRETMIQILQLMCATWLRLLIAKWEFCSKHGFGIRRTSNYNKLYTWHGRCQSNIYVIQARNQQELRFSIDNFSVVPYFGMPWPLT